MDEGSGETLGRDLRRPGGDQRSAEGEGSGVEKKRYAGYKTWLRMLGNCSRFGDACSQWYVERHGEMILELTTEVLYKITDCFTARFRGHCGGAAGLIQKRDAKESESTRI